MKIEWSEKYSVKVSELDEQHQKLIRLVEDLEKGSRAENFKLTIHEVVGELMEYVLVHFHTEEAYMLSAKYESLEEHKRIHEDLKVALNERVNEILSKEPTALDLVKLNNFLLKWIDEHILNEDHAYIDAMEDMHDL